LTEAIRATEHGQMRLLRWSRRHSFALLGAGAICIVAAVLALVFLGPVGVMREARCADLTDRGCGAFLQVLLSERQKEVLSVRAVLYCGAEECQVLFGPSDIARFVVTYRDGEEEQFTCSSDHGLATPRCEPAGP
jgi:hypothetical protein